MHGVISTKHGNFKFPNLYLYNYIAVASFAFLAQSAVGQGTNTTYPEIAARTLRHNESEK